MRKLATILIVFLSLGSLPGEVAAERDRPFRIGALTVSWGPTPAIVGLRDGLLKLGYREDEDFFLGVRFTQGDVGALSAAARELVPYGVDLILVDGVHAAMAAQKVTSQIPIVFASVSDPVGIALIKSFARPGGNITGVADLSVELSPKRLQLFQEIIPGLRRVVFAYDASDSFHMSEANVYREAAKRLGIELVEKPLKTDAEAEVVLTHLQKDKADGILIPRCCSLNIPGIVLDAVGKQAIPAMFGQAFWVERGALVSYGQDYYASGKQAARLVDKIIKGGNPAEIPVEVNSKIELAINLKTAKALGLTIAPEILYRADRLVR
jgi:putative ABC transport system substrate-binding protein